MKKPIGNRVLTRNLKTFLSISLGIHFSLSIVLTLIPDFRIEKLPDFSLEISLLPVIAEEKPPPKIIPPELKTGFKEQETPPSPPAKREEPVPQKELEPEPHLSMQAEEPKPPLPVQKKVKKSETESAPTSTAILLPAQSNPSPEKVENPFPLKTEEKPPPKIIPPELKTGFKEQENPPSRPEKREEPVPQKELEPEPHLSMQAEGPRPLPPVQKKVKKSETESAPTSTAILLPAQSNPSSEKVENPFSLKAASIAFPFNSAFGSKNLDKTLSSKIGPREESGNVSKLSSPSGGDITFTQPKYAENPKPLYPQEARKKGHQGEVMLKVEVLANGLVGKVEMKKSSSYELLDRSALAAVKQWKFIPAKKGEEVIPFWVNIPIKFQLR